MASVTGGLTIKQGAVKTAESQKAVTIQGLVAQADIKARFEELLGKKAPGFISSLLAVVNNNKLLAKANPKTVIAAGAMAASLDLPINQNLGFAYIIPYKDEAQFQMGYKGYIQLAMRTGQYQTINAAEVYEGEIIKQNRFTGEYEFGEKTSDKIVGYIAYFKLVNGFEKYLYMSIEEMQAQFVEYKCYVNGQFIDYVPEVIEPSKKDKIETLKKEAEIERDKLKEVFLTKQMKGLPTDDIKAKFKQIDVDLINKIKELK